MDTELSDSKSSSHDSETPALGQQVITVCAFIHKQIDGIEHVFMPKRASTKKFLPDVFELPGGHVDYGEELVTALKREVHEEFGMNIDCGDPFAAFTYVNDVKQSHSIEVIYFARFTDNDKDIKLNPDDHSEYRWVSNDNLDDIYTENKGVDDIEFQKLRRGFELLNGKPIIY